jgi:hypothetical protein
MNNGENYSKANYDSNSADFDDDAKEWDDFTNTLLQNYTRNR